MTQLKPGERFVSLDVMRGMIMILLAAEACRVYRAFRDLTEGGPLEWLAVQFSHHPWNGLRFWDLIQPAFMFMAGAALHISVTRKRAQGTPEKDIFRRTALRNLWLFLCGTGLHCIFAGKLVWELWNVLTQLSFTTLVAYFLIGRSPRTQIAWALGLVVLNDALYRFVQVPGFDEPFVKGKNFGSFIDMVLMGKLSGGGWAAFNCIPTAAHTILGVTAGQLLLSARSSAVKIKILIIAGAIALALGYAADWTGLSPIIKRISTGGFVLASLGWVLWILAFVFWLIDVKGWRRFAWIPIVVGMNSIFIYLFFETVGHQWLNGAVAIFTNGVSGWLGTPEAWQLLLAALAALVVEWGLCYWLYRKKIFFRL
ncbi:acyltransferase family protein [Chitinophaga lutea]